MKTLRQVSPIVTHEETEAQRGYVGCAAGEQQSGDLIQGLLTPGPVLFLLSHKLYT